MAFSRTSLNVVECKFSNKLTSCNRSMPFSCLFVWYGTLHRELGHSQLMRSDSTALLIAGQRLTYSKSGLVRSQGAGAEVSSLSKSSSIIQCLGNSELLHTLNKSPPRPGLDRARCSGCIVMTGIPTSVCIQSDAASPPMFSSVYPALA